MEKPRASSRKGRWRWALAAIAAALVLAAFGTDRFLKSRRHPGLATFIGQLVRNYPAGLAMQPVTLEVEVDDQDLAELERVVEQARARGVILPEGNSYVPARIAGPEGAFKAKVRIKGKLTDHVEGRKWSLRVIAKKDGGFLGMRRFSVQHPGTRNYLCDWLYHRLMAGEGVAALRYGFVRVRFNGDDLGIYAYEEHFGPELLERNGRMPGPIFRFDPALFWEHRLNEMDKLRFDEPFAAYQAAAIDAFGSSGLEKDKRFREQFEEAVGLVEAFRRGRLSASQVFDADRIARHHAILDLVGGHHSMDFSDVKFYYDPVMRRVEPISYESFSANPIRTLAGSGRWEGRSSPGMDLHTQWFNDEEVFRAYVHHLERVSRKEWLDSAFAALKPALDSASATLYREFPYKELDRSIYYRNQQVIRKLLDPPKAFHAYLQEDGPDTVRIAVVPIEALPIEVHELVLPDGAKASPVGRAIVPVRKPGRMGEPMELRFAVGREAGRSGLRLSCSVLGASVRREVEVFPQALLPMEEAMALAPAPVDPRTVAGIRFDEEAKAIYLGPGQIAIAGQVELPPGYAVRGTAPLQLHVAEGARLASRSPLVLEGLPEAPIEVRNDGALVIDRAAGRSAWRHVQLSGSGSAVVQDAALELADCALQCTGKADVLTAVRARLRLDGVSIEGGRDGLVAVASQVKAERSAILGPKDDGLVARGGMIDWNGGRIEGGKGAALKLGAQAEAALAEVKVEGGADGAEVRDGAALDWNGGAVKAKQAGLRVKDARLIAGPSRIALRRVGIEAAQAIVAGKGNQVTVDGKAVEGGAAEEHRAGEEPAEE